MTKRLARHATCDGTCVKADKAKATSAHSSGTNNRKDFVTQLIQYDAARTALQLVTSIDEVKDIRDKASAMAAYARQANDKQLIEWATEIKVRAERKAGEMLREVVDHSGGRPKQSHDATVSTLKDLGINKTQSSRWQKLANVPEDKFEAAVSAAKEIAGEVTTALMLKLNGAHVSNNSGNNEWYTPSNIIEAARKTMGRIDLDPASSEIANGVVKAEAFYTVEDNGLSKPWHGNVWMNPPYAQPLIYEFCQKIISEYQENRIFRACVLVNNATDTEWLQWLMAVSSAVCFIRGRIRFLDNELKPSGAPLQGQVVVYLGNDASDFISNFKEFGTVLSHA